MKLIYRLYQIFVAAPILLVLTIVASLFTIVGCTFFDASWWSYNPGRWWSRAVVRVLLLPVKQMPLVGKACESSGYIFVDQKGGPKKLQQMHDQARSVLQDGVSLVVFPEGARTWDGSLGRFKRGAFQLANELQLPLLPITINGSFQILPRARGYVNFVDWHPMTMTIHPALPPSEPTDEAERQLMQQAHDIIEQRIERD